MDNKNNARLGKGLSSIFGQDVSKVLDDIQNGDMEVERQEQSKIPVDEIRPNPYQPRKVFNDEALKELSSSIKQHGVFTPILVKKSIQGYDLIAGERRLRASKLAGLKDIPAIIVDFDDQEMMEIALLENIQREDLNPIEEAQAYKRLLTEFHLKQDEVAERVSKSRAAVTNSIRLLKLNEDVQRMVVDEMISTGHARALLAVENPEEQYNLAQRIFDEKLSVRDVEKLVKNLHKPEKPKKTDDKTMQVIYQDIEEKLKQKLGRKVTVTSRGEGSGKIEIEFYNHEDLDRLLDVLNK